MFKFNFGDDDAGGAAAGGVGGDGGVPQLPSKEEKFADVNKDDYLDEMAVEALFEPIEVDADLCMHRCRIPATETLGALAEVVESSDLAPGVYEGGFKVWEGCVDLVRHLKERGVEVEGKKVIELGCGHALPGLWAAMQGAEVDLQDYNREVLETVTLPNVLVNLKDCPKGADSLRYFSGDWGSLAGVVGGGRYDVALTAETIYSEEAVHRLIECLGSVLKREGVAYIAAKSYYFGVGGSTHRFTQLVGEKLPRRELSQVALIQDGQSNVREILLLSGEK